MGETTLHGFLEMVLSCREFLFTRVSKYLCNLTVNTQIAIQKSSLFE